VRASRKPTTHQPVAISTISKSLQVVEDSLVGRLGCTLMDANMVSLRNVLLVGLLMIPIVAAAAGLQCLDQSTTGFLNRIRLDAQRDAYLVQTSSAAGNVLYVVQYRQNARCPVVLDRVVGTRRGASFEYECSVTGHVSEAAVALVTYDASGKIAAVVKAWLIEPKSLHFVSTAEKATCSQEGFSGADEGTDLMSRARAR